VEVRASSDSLNSRLIDKAFCPVNNYQQIKKKKKKKAGGKLCVLQRRQRRKLRGAKEQNMEFSWR